MNFIRKYKRYFLAFLVPLVVYGFVFYIKSDFMKNTILNGDMQSQYLSLFEYLRNVLHGDASFPYSFSKGLGGGMYGTYFYYLACPLNFFVYFFENVPLFLEVLTLFKLGLCELTMYIFLRYKFKEDNNFILIFALAYAFMTYNVNYYTNIMWLDGVILAPLLLLSIDRIIEEKSNLLYIVILALVIYLNYYMGYILTLFSLIYFLYLFLGKYQKKWRKEYKQIINFVLVTFLTGLMMAFILFPCALEMFETSRVNSIEDIKIINFNFLDLISSFCIGFGDLRFPLNYNGFCVYAGVVMIPLIICYFASSKFSSYEKKLTIFVYVLLILPIFLPIFNMVWHMFSVPNGFNYRYSFLVTLFTLVIAYKSFKNLKYTNWLKYYFALFLIFILSLSYSVIKKPDYYFLDVYKIGVTVIFTLINIILIYKNKKVLIIVLLCADLGINLLWIYSAGFITSYKGYNLAKEDIQKFASTCSEYRCESVSSYTYANDSFLGNYKGESMFLSTINKDLISFLAISSDVSVYRNYYLYHPDVILDMLMGVKLIKADGIITGYDFITKDKYGLYWLKNSNALSLGYTVSSKIKKFESTKKGFFYLEDVLNSLDDEVNNYIKEIPLTKVSDTEYKLYKDRKYPYLYLYTGNDDGLKAKINGREAKKVLFNGKHYTAIYDNYGNELDFTFNKKVSDFKVYTVDLKAVQKFRKNREEMVIDKNKGNYIKGHINVSNNSVLMTSIPYDRGFDVYINGKKVDDYKVLDSFLAFDIQKGYSKIEIKYHVYGFIPGLIISLMSFISLIIYELFYFRKKF